MNRLDRYKILINHLKSLGVIESQQDLGRKMGYKNPSAFSQVINGKASEPKLFIQKLKEIYPPLNSEWLINGTGDMYNKVEQPSSVTQYGSNVNTTGDNNHIEQSALLDKALGEISELRKALVDALQVNQRQAERLLDILQTYGNMSTFGGSTNNKQLNDNHL
jgi:hypothetical protein